MDTLLIAVTLVALAIAAAMSVVVLKLLREDRRRSEARIAALLEAAAAGGSPPLRAARTPPLDAGRKPPLDAARKPPLDAARRPPLDAARKPPLDAARRPPLDAARRLPLHGAASTARTTEAPRKGGAHGTADLPLRAAPTQDLFVEPEARASWGPRIALAAGALAVLLGVGFTLFGPSASVRSQSPAPRAGVAPATPPLELLTLRHAAAAGSLTVSGVVQNPRGAAALRRVTAMVHVLDAGGAIVATHRAPIDLATFGPGEESPFHVTVPVQSAVARYRIGFRTEGGDVLAHVDRRTGAEALAHK